MSTRPGRGRPRWLPLGLMGAVLTGCQHLGQDAKHPTVGGRHRGEGHLTRAQGADLHIALGRAAEAQGELDRAAAAYRAALESDPKNGEAYARLAVVHDKRGEFGQSETLYRQAIEASPGNPDVFCDKGYSLYLQRRWAESEINLKQAITLAPEHRRAHNNLGLLLAQDGRDAAALVEFRKAGLSPADAHNNLAFAMTLQRRWNDAREQYRLALAADPTSETARQRLEALDALVAKVDPPTPPAPAPVQASAPVAPQPRPAAPVATPPAQVAARPAPTSVTQRAPAPATRDANLVPTATLAPSPTPPAATAGAPQPEPTAAAEAMPATTGVEISRRMIRRPLKSAATGQPSDLPELPGR